jgi:hypothetical protein
LTTETAEPVVVHGIEDSCAVVLCDRREAKGEVGEMLEVYHLWPLLLYNLAEGCVD